MLDEENAREICYEGKQFVLPENPPSHNFSNGRIYMIKCALQRYKKIIIKCVIPDDNPVSVQQHDTQLDTNPPQFERDTEL